MEYNEMNQENVQNTEQEVEVIDNNKVVSLADFLLDNPVDDMVFSVVMEGRFEGKEFKVKPITDAQLDLARQKATKGGKSQLSSEVLHSSIITQCVIEPNFKSEDFLSRAGVSTPEQAINKFLLSGEKSRLADKILQVSGYSDDEELYEVAKN